MATDSSNDTTTDPMRTAAQNQANATRASFQRVQVGKKAGVLATGAAIVALGVLAPTQVGNGFPDFIDNGTCGMAGANRSGKPLDADETLRNPLKNRITVPDMGAIDSAVEIGNFLGPDENTKENSTVLNQNKAATVTGYIVKIVSGGAETCNCQTIDSQYYDTHIYLSDTKPGDASTSTGGSPTSHAMIVEVTPRMRQIVKGGSDEWNTTNLQKTFPRGTKVTVTGWQFYDKEHEAQAFNIHHRPSDWRYSCWEIHPVTAIDATP